MAPALFRPAPCSQILGKRKALSVSIGYSKLAETWPKDNYRLPNSHKDSIALRKMLIDLYGYDSEDIKIMLDDDSGKYELPTMKNMRKALKDLVKGAKAGDHFVFHFSGHGSQVVNLDGKEVDGYDEVIWPVDVDIRKAGDDEEKVIKYIIDDYLYKILVEGIPAGAHMTVLLDCCHSGTGVDLPYNYSDSSLDEQWTASPTLQSPICGHENIFTNARGMSIDTITSITSKVRSSSTGSNLVKRNVRGLTRSMRLPYSARGNTLSCGVDTDLRTNIEDLYSKLNPGTVLDKHVTSWSACLDEQLALDYHEGGILTQSLVKLLRHQQERSHKQLLTALSEELYKLARKARRAWTRDPDMHELAKEFALPKPSIGSLRPVDEILEHTFTF